MNEQTVNAVTMSADVECFGGLAPRHVAKVETDSDVSYRVYWGSDLKTFAPRRADVPSRTRLPITAPSIDRRTIACWIAAGVALSAFLIGAVLVGATGLEHGKTAGATTASLVKVVTR